MCVCVCVQEGYWGLVGLGMAGDISFLVGKGSDDFGRNPNTLGKLKDLL